MCSRPFFQIHPVTFLQYSISNFRREPRRAVTNGGRRITTTLVVLPCFCYHGLISSLTLMLLSRGPRSHQAPSVFLHISSPLASKYICAPLYPQRTLIPQHILSFSLVLLISDYVIFLFIVYLLPQECSREAVFLFHRVCRSCTVLDA